MDGRYRQGALYCESTHRKCYLYQSKGLSDTTRLFSPTEGLGGSPFQVRLHARSESGLIEKRCNSVRKTLEGSQNLAIGDASDAKYSNPRSRKSYQIQDTC